MYNTAKYFLLLVLAVTVSSRTFFEEVLGEEWRAFKQEHSKVYKNSREERLRNKIYLKNKLKIIQHNNLYELGQVSFELGLNEYSDLEQSEFIARMNGGFNSSIINLSQFESETATYIVPDSDIRVPSSFDWTSRGAVTPVKNQKQCGSCWSFAATGSLEGQHFRKSGKLISLSEQNLIDCSRSYGTYGCNGGWMGYAYNYIAKNGGIESEQSYPYEGRDANCRYESKFNTGVTVKTSVRITPGDENALKVAVATIGPVAITIDASLGTFRFYKGGIYYDRNCNPESLNHAVLVTGYGTTQNGQDYWTIKNSWGTSWGQDGYFFLARNKNNHCGVSSAAIYPQV